MVSSTKTLSVLRGDAARETAVRPVPPLNTLYFYLTEGCNLRCRHCWLEPPHSRKSGNTRPLTRISSGTSLGRPCRWA